MTQTVNWYHAGLTKGWAGVPEQEMIRFMEKEYGSLTSDEKLYAVFASLFLNSGHVCLPLDKSAAEWARILELDDVSVSMLESVTHGRSKITEGMIIGRPGDFKPLIIDNNKLSFHRYRQYEIDLAEWLNKKSSVTTSFKPDKTAKELLDLLLPLGGDETNWQKAAAALSIIKPFLIISGGPGTGKTTTVAAILALHQMLFGKQLRVALAAPTGKAAGRMGESLHRELSSTNIAGLQPELFPREAKTVHRLLRGVEERGLLPSAKKELLRYDLVIIDEASMIDLNLMHRLLKHLSDDTRLILLGDRDQLASVEAGAVFADLCRKESNRFSMESLSFLGDLGIKTDIPEIEENGLKDSIVYLTKSYRFDKDSGIGLLADMVKKRESDPGVYQELFKGQEELKHVPFDYSAESIRKLTSAIIDKVNGASGIHDPKKMLRHWKQMIWLVVLRRGLEGSEYLNQMAEQVISRSHTVKREGEWYHGRLVMITQNDYNLGLFNGDMGVCLMDEEGIFSVYIESGAKLKKVRAGRLVHYQPAYFLTVHKSQGSEFDSVNLLLPNRDTPILTRELIYTAITRARKSFSLYGSMERFVSGSQKVMERYSGLSDRL
jgi:exodeoxyribonuclease V alpha subunit